MSEVEKNIAIDYLINRVNALKAGIKALEAVGYQTDESNALKELIWEARAEIKALENR